METFSLVILGLFEWTGRDAHGAGPWQPMGTHGRSAFIIFFSILFHFPFYSDIAEIALCSG